MKNDKAFAFYAVALVLMLAGVLTTVVVAGIGAVPSLALFAEHITIGLLIRASYKSFAGPGWAFGNAAGAASAAVEAATSIAPTADALG